jgi:predicted HD superfamily hydrolase involved in NAD metabolism
MPGVSREFLITTMKKTLSPARLRHSLSVARLCQKLGKIHGWNPEKAFRAGLLHDCVKEWPPLKLAAYADKRKLSIPDRDFIRAASPNMLHAYVGAAYAKEKGWITDPASLIAIASHTLGNLNMSREDKILFIADFSCADRKRNKLKKIRRLAARHLDEGFAAAITLKLKYYLKRRKAIHPFAVEVWNSMMSGL